MPKPVDVDLEGGLLHVNRKKHGVPSTHPLLGWELRASPQLKRDAGEVRFVIMGERGSLTRAWLQRPMERVGEEAGFDFPIHPHILRHAAGYKFANEGQDTPVAAKLAVPSLDRAHGPLHQLSAERFRDWRRELAANAKLQDGRRMSAIRGNSENIFSP